jgi:NAD(P)H-dependent FMN reductase
MKIGVLAGSNRAASESGRIARWFAHEIDGRDGIESELVDFHDTPISFVPEEIWGGHDANFNAIKTALAQCDAFVVIAPEWGGAASPVIRNALLFLGSAVFADKPVYLVGVATGRGGLRPILEIRSFSYKNNYACYIPEWLVASECDKHFTGDSADDDDYLVKRARYGLDTLVAYATALKTVRAAHPRDLETYKFGM